MDDDDEVIISGRVQHGGAVVSMEMSDGPLMIMVKAQMVVMEKSMMI